MKIRWLIRPDLDSVLAIEDRSFDFPWTREDFLHHLSQRNCIGIVMEGRCGDVIAYAVYEQHKQRIELLNLAVHPDHRFKGVGTKLMERLISKLSPMKRRKLVLNVGERNTAAHLFFRSAGFKATGVLRNHYDHCDDDAYSFEYVSHELV